jgi:hypothetical protein
MLGPCWQKLFALNCLAPDHSAICPATLSFSLFFRLVDAQHCWPSATCSDLIAHAGARAWLHQTLIEVPSPVS